MKALTLCLLSLSVGAAEPPLSLEPLTVTATGHASPLADVPGSISLISRAQLSASGDDLTDALRGVGGVSLQGLGSGGRRALGLRGMDARHTLLLIDGRRIPGSNDEIGPNTDYQYAWLAPEQIERIEIVRGPMSTLYGSDALGGVINLITRDGDDTWRGSLRGRIQESREDADGHALNAYLSGPLSAAAGLQLSARQARRAALAERAEPRRSAIEGQEQQQLGMALDWRANSAHTLRLSHNESRENRWYDTLTRAGLAYQSRYELTRRHSALGWEGWLGEGNATLRLYQSHLQVENSATQGVAATAPQALRERVAEGRIDAPWGERHLLTLGSDYRAVRLEHPELADGEANAHSVSLYGQDDIEFNPRWRLLLGARLDRHSASGTAFSPRLAAGWNFAPGWRLRAAYAHGFRAPTLKQSAPAYQFAAGRFIIRSNPALQPERNDAWEIGARYRDTVWQFDAAAFDNRVRDLIDTRFARTLANGVQEWTYANIASARLRGLELSARWQATAALALNLNYQYLDARDGDGTRLEHRPRQQLGAALEWRRADWGATLRMDYSGEQRATPPGLSQAQTLPGYALWRASLSKRWNRNLTLMLGVNNLSDVRLEEKSAAFRHEEYPRSLWLELRAAF